MKRFLFILFLFVSLLTQAQIRPGVPNPPTLTYRQRNTNQLDMIISSAGQLITPSNSVSITAEIRISDVGRIVANVPMTTVDSVDGTIRGMLPNLDPSIYYLGLYIKYASGEPEFRVGVGRLEIVPTGSLRVVTDASGLNIQISEVRQVLNVKLDATPSSAIAAYYAQQARADVSTINQTQAAAQANANAAGQSAADALAYKNAAATSAGLSSASATYAATQATAAQGYASSAGTSATNASTSETNALASKNAAITSASQASASASAAASSATNAATSEANALASKNAAATSASSASASAVSANTSATNAANSATNSATSAAAAAGSATSAANSALAAVQAFKGPWTANTTYATGDIVTNGGSSYRRKAAGTSGSSFDSSMWDMTAQGGSVVDGAVTTAKLASDVLHKNFPFQINASPPATLKAAIKDIQIVGLALNPSTLLTLAVFRKNITGTGRYTIQVYDYTAGNFLTQAYNFDKNSYTPSATVERLAVTGSGSFSATTLYVTVDWSQAADNTDLNSMNYNTAGLSNLVFRPAPLAAPADLTVTSAKFSTSVQTTLNRRLQGKNLLKNYRLEGVGTYPDNFYLERTSGSAYVGIVTGTSPTSLVSAKFTVAATSGASGYAIWYQQGINTTSLGIAGKSARLWFWIKTDIALSNIYIRPRVGTTSGTPDYNNLTSQNTPGQWSLVKSNVFALDAGTDVGYGAYLNMNAASFGTTANVEISGMMVRLEDDGDVSGFEYNSNYEAVRSSGFVTSDDVNALLLNPRGISLSLPEKIYAVKGDQLEVFKRSILKIANPANVGLAVANSSYPAAKGNFYERVYRYTPGSSDVSFPLAFEVKDENSAVLATGSTQIVVTAKKSSPSSNKNILLIGDSFTQQAWYPNELARRLTGTGGSPAGDGLTNLTFIGTQGGTGTRHEGWSGKTYSFFESNQSPFWNPNTSQVDFNYYCTQNGYSGIDYVVIILGTNAKEDNSIISALWDKLLAHNSNIKVLIGGCIFANPQNGWGSIALDQVDNPTGRNFLASIKTTLDYNRRLEALTKTSPYVNNFFFADILPGFDMDFNMQYNNAAQANARNSTATIPQGTDNVHPASSGYWQIADTMYRGFHAVIFSITDWQLLVLLLLLAGQTQKRKKMRQDRAALPRIKSHQ
ncbi:hypothetical protein [Spirosoma litoris]